MYRDRNSNECTTEVPECDSLVAILAIPIGIVIELRALFLYIALRIHTSR